MMKPILFNTEMVRAILEGRKTVTRRVIKTRYKDGEAGFRVNRSCLTGQITGVEIYDEEECGTNRYVKPPYLVGDVLYVRETWNGLRTGNPLVGFHETYWYKADEKDGNPDDRWRPSIHMPRKAARIFLRVTGVSVERLQDITPKQAGEEGVRWVTDNSGLFRKYEFAKLWNSTIPKKDFDKYSWKANPWVWVIEFERRKNEET